VGALGFYSFVLLPSALKFDFRRDFERLHVLKALPLPSMVVSLGQIATPVILTTAYQAFVLAIVTWFRPVPASYVLTAMLGLLPANIFIYGLENLLFLLSPHRMQQEGFEVFLKTTLAFTAKGVLFLAAISVVFSWVFAARSLANALDLNRGFVFVVGLSVISWLTALAAMLLLAYIFRRTDASWNQVG
jgi:hypothetical protein